MTTIEQRQRTCNYCSTEFATPKLFAAHWAACPVRFKPAPTASDTHAELAALRDEVARLREAMSEALVIIDEQAPALSGWRARDVMAALRAALEVAR